MGIAPGALIFHAQIVTASTAGAPASFEQSAVETSRLGVGIDQKYIHDRIIVSIILNRLMALSACG